MANEYSADIPKGLNVPKQVRLDSITSIQNEAALKNLGPGNNLAFKYYDGLKVYCKDEKTEYIWREVVGIETGLLDVHFTYPTYSPVDGIDYSGKSYNFFQESKTKITAGVNTTVTGLGTIASPYVVNSTDTVADGSETKVTAGTNITVTGNGTIATPYVVNSTASAVNQDNFVRTITINEPDLPIGYTEQDICDYVLALPTNQRTILETDSKWNIVIIENPS